MNTPRFILLFFLLGSLQSLLAQARLDSFFKPSDSLSIARRNIVVGSEVIVAGGALAGLSALWYKDYPQSDFHFINDNAQWLQMDKAGHAFSTYHAGRFGSELLQWSGASKKSQLVYGATLGFAFMSVVEVFDGYSTQWGASWGDVAANASGTVLYIGQELLWNEQRITPKFSFHRTVYPSARPNVLGSSWNEEIIKDYNGQTYWLSVNLQSFFKTSKIPKWLNVAAGYGAEGMITGQDALVNTVFLPEKQRTRQFYLSFDADLTKIQTKSHTLKAIFSVFNTIKIPAPAFEINDRGRTRWHGFYF